MNKRYHSGGIAGLSREAAIVGFGPHVVRAVMRDISAEEQKRKALIASESEVKKGDTLKLREATVRVCRVQRKKNAHDLDVYICTNGAVTFFIMETEVGSHQHFRNGTLVLDLVRALRDTSSGAWL